MRYACVMIPEIFTSRTLYHGRYLHTMNRVGIAFCVLCCLFLPACTDTTPAIDQHTLVFSRIVDLSHVITQDMPHLPGEALTQLARPTDDAVAQALQISVRSGTHLSAPAALSREYTTVDRISPRDIVVPIVVLDVRDRAQDDPEYLLSVDELRAWERYHGRIPAGAIVLLATGWDMRWGSPGEYLNLDERQVPVVPGFGAAAVELLLQQRQVGGLGIDTPNIDGRAISSDSPSRQVLADGRLLLENLTNLEQLSPTGSTLMIGALKIQAGAGSPVRALALVP